MTEWKARPTTYNGIEMRSRLEARYAAALDDGKYRWEYEPRAFANQRGQYLPDFALLNGEGERVTYIEVKPTEQLAWLATKRMEIIWDSEPDVLLYATWPQGDSWQEVIAEPPEHEWRRGIELCSDCAALRLRLTDVIAERDDLRTRLDAIDSYRGNGRMESVADILKAIAS